MKKIKLLLQKPFVKNVIVPLAEGLIQAVPLGNAISKIVPAVAKVISNVTAKKVVETPKKVEWFKYAVEIVGIVGIVLLFKWHIITVADLKVILTLVGLGN